MTITSPAREVALLAIASCLGGLSLLSCADPTGAPKESSDGAPSRTAVIVATLLNIPSDALCLELSVSASAIPEGTRTQLSSITRGLLPPSR